MTAILLLTNCFTKLRKLKADICPPSHLDGFSTEKEAKRAKTTKELEYYSTLAVALP
jgi:hypothetical protein